jgi:hypothetical protein
LDFIDGALRWSLRRVLRRKPVDPRWVLHITKAYVGAFIRHAFGMQSSPVPGGTVGGMPGVRVEVYRRSAGGEPRDETAGEARQQQSDRAGI